MMIFWKINKMLNLNRNKVILFGAPWSDGLCLNSEKNHCAVLLWATLSFHAVCRCFALGTQCQAETLYLGIAFWPKTRHTNKTSSQFCCLCLSVAPIPFLNSCSLSLSYYCVVMEREKPVESFSHACCLCMRRRTFPHERVVLAKNTAAEDVWSTFSHTESFHKPTSSEEMINWKRLLRFIC